MSSNNMISGEQAYACVDGYTCERQEAHTAFSQVGGGDKGTSLKEYQTWPSTFAGAGGGFD